MPRRPAPTALHLSTGPLPGRGEARHTLPAPPQPVFHPKTITKPRSDSLSSGNQRRPSGPAPSLLGYMGADPTDKASVDGVMFESANERAYIPQWDTKPVASMLTYTKCSQELTNTASPTGSTISRRVQPGPWDRTRSNTLPPERIAELVALPKPVVANPAPLW
ncbi:hypothetical protein RhiJN_17647 [Ceratobasidium sp. AG-Ba]|nr:hypothetical protein RhiJN_17647 [Ceratobasidium sp. AG-Ba]